MKKLNTKGIAHFTALAVIVVGLAAFGTFMLVRSHAATCANYTWSYGKTGSCVASIQEILAWNGYGNKYGADGIFGSLTKANVVSFQKAHGLTGAAADGVVGPNTRSKMCATRTSVMRLAIHTGEANTVDNSKYGTTIANSYTALCN